MLMVRSPINPAIPGNEETREVDVSTVDIPLASALTDDCNTQHVLLRCNPAKEHTPNELKSASGCLQKTRPQSVEAETFDERRDKVGDATVQDAGTDPHK